MSQVHVRFCILRFASSSAARTSTYDMTAIDEAQDEHFGWIGFRGKGQAVETPCRAGVCAVKIAQESGTISCAGGPVNHSLFMATEIRILDLLDSWRHLPAYQLERRADVFFAFYLPRFLANKFGTPVSDLLIPEFPLHHRTIWPAVQRNT